MLYYFHRNKSSIGYLSLPHSPLLAHGLLVLQYFSSFVFKKDHGFIEEDNPSEKAVIVEEKLNCADIDDIENLEDLPRFVLIDEKCRNLKVVKDGGELTRNSNQKKNSDVS